MQLPTKEFLELFKKTPGAISVCESIAITNIAAQAPKGVNIECGSHAGKSGMSAAAGLKNGGKFNMIDPVYDLTNLEAWKHTVQEHPDNMGWLYFKEDGFYEKVKENILVASHGKIEPVLLGDYSQNVLPKYDGYAYVFIDSDNHSHERVYSELEIIKPKMLQGGIIAFHDFGNQYIAPREAHQHLIDTGEFENVHVDWNEIFIYVRENNLEEGNDSWHEKGSNEFPCYVGAVRKK